MSKLQSNSPFRIVLEFKEGSGKKPKKIPVAELVREAAIRRLEEEWQKIDGPKKLAQLQFKLKNEKRFKTFYKMQPGPNGKTVGQTVA